MTSPRRTQLIILMYSVPFLWMDVNIMPLMFSRMVKMKPGYSDRRKPTEAIWYSQTSRSSSSRRRTSVTQSVSQSASQSLGRHWVGWSAVTSRTLTVHQRSKWEKEKVNETRQEDVFEKVLWWKEEKSITGKLKLLILLDLQPIKIYHACLHVGIVSVISKSGETANQSHLTFSHRKNL